MTDAIKAKRGKQWYLWTRNPLGWVCSPCDWTGRPMVGVGVGQTRDEAFADLVGGA